jgi:hypothetical protein
MDPDLDLTIVDRPNTNHSNIPATLVYLQEYIFIQISEPLAFTSLI